METILFASEKCLCEGHCDSFLLFLQAVVILS